MHWPRLTKPQKTVLLVLSNAPVCMQQLLYTEIIAPGFGNFHMYISCACILSLPRMSTGNLIQKSRHFSP